MVRRLRRHHGGWMMLSYWHESPRRLHEILLAELNAARVLDRSRAVVDSLNMRARSVPLQPATQYLTFARTS
jgi:hypothetical protein